jgi:hypothetical protein
LVSNIDFICAIRRFMRLEPLISHTGILMTFYLSIILDLQNFFHWYILQSWKLKRFQEIRIIATGPCIANQLRDVNTICRRNWYIAAHVWKNYDFKIEVVPFYLSIILDLQNFFHWYILQSWKLKRPHIQLRPHHFWTYIQEIRIIATGPCIANQLRDVNTICRRSWYIAAHVWKIYDFKIKGPN